MGFRKASSQSSSPHDHGFEGLEGRVSKELQNTNASNLNAGVTNVVQDEDENMHYLYLAKTLCYTHDQAVRRRWPGIHQ
jgi:hypothetical protein